MKRIPEKSGILFIFGVMPPGQRHKGPANQIAEERGTGDFTSEQQRGILYKAGISLLRLRTGITDQGEAFANRTDRDTEDAGTVHPAAEAHGGLVAVADEVFRIQKFKDFLNPDLQAGFLGSGAAGPDGRRGEQDPREQPE